MKMIELVAPCHFGMEAVLKREILDLGYEISQVEDGRVTFLGIWRQWPMPMYFSGRQNGS